MKIQRTNSTNPTDANLVNSVEYNIYAGAKKIINAGPQLEIIGAINSPKRVGEGVSLLLYNNSGAVAWVNFHNAKQNETPVAPTGIANAIAIPANSYLALNSGTKDTVTASAATVGAYKIKDDTQLVTNYER